MLQPPSNATHGDRDLSLSSLNASPPSSSDGDNGWRLGRNVGLILGLATCIGLGVWGQQGQTQDTSPIKAEQALSVMASQVEPVSTYSVTRTYTGQIVARRTSNLGFERAGAVVELLAQEGDWVTTGQPLAQLGSQGLQTQRQQLVAQRDQAVAQLQELEAGPRAETIAAAQAQVQEIQEQQTLATMRQTRRQELYDEGAISQENLDEAATQTAALSSQLDMAQSNLDELLTGTRPEQIAAQQAQVRQLEAAIATVDVDLKKSVLKAPFTGQISTQEVSEGTVVNPGQVVFRLVEKNGLEAHIGVPVDSVEQFGVGQTKSLRINEQPYIGRVSSVLPEVTTPTRTATVIFVFAEATDLIVGQTVQLETTQTLSAEDSYWVPTSALLPGVKGLWSVYTLTDIPSSDKDENESIQQVQQTTVEVIYTEGDRALVRGTLTPGDAIITGPQRVAPGQHVRPIEP